MASLKVELWQSKRRKKGVQPGSMPGSNSVLTCDMQLVQPVIGQGCISRTALSFVLKASCSGWGSPPALEDFFEYPAYQAQLLQAVPDHIPGEAAGQVQAGGR